ncbi:diglucosylglycerate octanoyltransferase [Actinomycetospora sp. TBRC 11914]|uniref:diglucosylglycerate octanoyltransferase n=1 Tax=Actinomycetospora sp. TBRC 11914 TaxID=2729387 RepID=UPI0028A24CF0|nr:diglucosylglycerate octanoyltransferase [Actinomycetospora sp. TBRC 11914]
MTPDGRVAPHLLVLGDSLAFHGPRTAHPADEPRLWPHVAAAALGGTADLHAGLGWTARHAWSAVRTDPRVWASVRHTDVLVLGVGGMDSLPSPLPTALRELIPVLRPAGLRARVRAGYRAGHAAAATAGARWAGGWPTALSAAETVRCLEQCRVAVTALRPHAPVVLLLPPVHRSPLYGGVHRRRSGHVAALRAWAAGHGVVTVEAAGLVAEHVLTGHGNPDGIHWGWPGHRAVGEAVAAAVAGELPAPRGGGPAVREEQPAIPTGSGTPGGPQARSQRSEETPVRP